MENKFLKGIKICHVTTVDITARFIILDFMRFLKEQGCNVFVACSFSKFRPFLDSEGFNTKNIKMTRRITPAQDFVSLIKLFLYFKKEKFDIVHTYTPKAGILGRIAAKLAGVPVVIHTSYGFYMGVKVPKGQKSLILFAEKTASLFCDLVFSQNKEDIDFAVKNKIVNPQKIKLLTYGIDIKRFNLEKFDRDFIQKKKKDLGIENKKIIGVVGRFVKEKGYLDLFEAFKIIKKQIPEAFLLLIAPKDKEKPDALDISILKDYGIEKDAVVLGYEKEILNIEEFYPLMDVFALPSYREGFPYSIMEASASGKPVVATDIRGCREAVENNNTGLLFPAGDYKKMAEIIVYLFKNPEVSVKIGYNGRTKAERDFDERNIFGKITKEYKELTDKKL
jgi:glycosyltransferase involved in cell wall biosynthesis